MNIEDQNKKNSVIIKKAKKQAKKLLTIASNENGILKVQNISEAQEIMAQLYEYPNWHTLNNCSNNLEEIFNIHTNMDLIPLRINKYFPILELNKSVNTFFQIKYLPYQNSDYFFTLLEKTIDLLKSCFLDSPNNVEIFITKNNIPSITKDFLFYLNPEITVSESIVHKLFSHNENSEEKGNFSIFLAISSPINNLEQHESSCQLISKHFNSLVVSKEFLTKQEYDLITGKNISKTYKSSFINTFFNNKKDYKFYRNNLVQILHTFNKVNDSGTISFNMNDKTLTYFHEDSEINDNLDKQLNDFFHKEIKAENNLPTIPFTYHSKKLPWNKGIKFKNLDNCQEYVDTTTENTQFNNHNIGICGMSKSGKSYLAKSIILNNLLSKKNNNFGLLTCGDEYKALFNIVKSLFPSKSINYIIPDFEGNNTINLFDTPLGCRQPTVSSSIGIDYLVELLFVICFDKNNHNIGSNKAFLNNLIFYTYDRLSDTNEAKIYMPQINNTVDKAIFDENIYYDEHTSWWNITDALFIKKRYSEAMLAQRQAMPVIQDFIDSISSSTIMETIPQFYNDIDTQIFIEQILTELNKFANDYPSLCYATNIDFPKYSFCIIDLEKMIFKSKNFKTYHKFICFIIGQYLLGNYIQNGENSNVTNINLGESYTDDIPINDYKSFHNSKINNNIGTTYCYDETFDFVANYESFVKLFQQTLSSSRKYDNQHIIVSANLFPIIEFNQYISIFFYMGKPNSSIYEMLDKHYQIDLDVSYYLKHEGLSREMHKPGKTLAMFQGICNTSAILHLPTTEPFLNALK